MNGNGMHTVPQRQGLNEDPLHQEVSDLRGKPIDYILVGHCRRNQMLSKLWRIYWILKANVAAKKITHNCILYGWWHETAVKQKIADLPLSRITPDLPPFTLTRLDYFGPIEVKRGHSRVKGYGALFTCLISRAVQMEILLMVLTMQVHENISSK